jgi:muramoyltetrapeptide carboxypeptidase
MREASSLLPPFLKTGDRILLLSPSGNMASEPVEAAINVLHSMGFQVELSAHALGCAGIYSGTDDERLADLQAALDRTDVAAIWCIRGGYGAMRIIDGLDFSGFMKHPKWLVGFSDITVLHAALQKRGVASLHAPMMKHIAEHGPYDRDLNHTIELMKGIRMTTDAIACEMSRCGHASGILVGGNLSLIYALRGTPYDINPEGRILFIEDLSEYHYHLDRMMQNLRLGGVLEKIAGLVVGQFTDMKDGSTPYGSDAYSIIAGAVEKYNYPVWFGFPAGHDIPNQPLMLGTEVNLSVEPRRGCLEYLY